MYVRLQDSIDNMRFLRIMLFIEIEDLLKKDLLVRREKKWEKGK